MPHVLYDYCESADYNAYNCPYHIYMDATCEILGKTRNEMTDKTVETMKEKIVEYSEYLHRA